MIYCDQTHDVCPFCGNKMELNKEKYECDICRGQIYEQTCPETNNKYYITSIKKYKSYIKNNNQQQEKRKFSLWNLFSFIKKYYFKSNYKL